MNSPVTTSPLLSAAGNRDAAPAGQAARQRADCGDGGDGSDTRFSDLLPARHPASTAPADRADKTGEAGAHAHGPKRRQAEQAQDDGSAAALLAAAQAGAAGQPPSKAVDGAATSALAADAVAAAGLAKAQGGAAQANAGEPAALGPGGDAQTTQAGPASLAQLIHDQLETARPARTQAQTADESDAAQAGTRMAAQRTGAPSDDGSAPGTTADAARQAAQGASGAQARQAATHDARAMARHTPQLSPLEKAGKNADAANATNVTNAMNAASAVAAQQAATAGVDASAALSAQAAALASTQATLAAASPDAANPGSTARIGTPLGHPQWAEDFSRQVLVLSSGDLRNQSVKLHVNPPELGPLHIALNINNNVAHAVFASAHAEVRNAIENALPQLQQALAQNGLALGQANVGEQRQFAQEFNEPSGQKKRGAGFTLGVTAPGAAAAMDAAPRRVAGSSLVDTFA